MIKHSESQLFNRAQAPMVPKQRAGLRTCTSMRTLPILGVSRHPLRMFSWIHAPPLGLLHTHDLHARAMKSIGRVHQFHCDGRLLVFAWARWLPMVKPYHLRPRKCCIFRHIELSFAQPESLSSARIPRSTPRQLVVGLHSSCPHSLCNVEANSHFSRSTTTSRNAL